MPAYAGMTNYYTVSKGWGNFTFYDFIILGIVWNLDFGIRNFPGYAYPGGIVVVAE